MSSFSQNSNHQPDPSSIDDISSQLFRELVTWQTQIALMFLGEIPNPQTGKKQIDHNQAQIAIGILEMLEHKTKGNLSIEEAQLLRDCLTHVHLKYLESLQRGNRNTNPPDNEKTAI